MSQEDIKEKVARKALSLCKERIYNNSGVAIPEILESIKAQLEWLVSYFEGRNNEREKLHSLVFGRYAARELDERDDEFIEALYKANYVASQTASGLKIDLNVIENDSEKLLLRNLSKLKNLFKDFASTSESNDSKEAFISAGQQCNDIISKIESQNFSEASRLWKALMYFTNDSIGISEGFLSKFQHLRQQVINSGLQ